MNLKFIDKVIASYDSSLEDSDKARLNFFRGIWEEVEKWASSSTAAHAHYTVPAKETIEAAWADDKPVFSFAPPKLSFSRTCSIAQSLFTYITDAENLGASALSDEASACIEEFSFTDFLTEKDLSDACKNPEKMLDEFFENVNEHYLKETRTTETAQTIARFASLSLLWALRADFEGVARVISKEQPKGFSETHHPLTCPVCGSAPALARIGGENETEGRGRTLYCQQCGNTWAFERVRCVRCGTRNQGHLHYFNVEGDDGHRIATCDECGGYVRSIFVDDVLQPFSFEVEEVITARLDAIAHDPKFQA